MIANSPQTVASCSGRVASKALPGGRTLRYSSRRHTVVAPVQAAAEDTGEVLSWSARVNFEVQGC